MSVIIVRLSMGLAYQCCFLFDQWPGGKVPPGSQFLTFQGAIREPRPRIPLFPSGSPLQAVIHVELDRVRGHAQTSDVFFLQGDVRVDQIVTEDVACFQEGPVRVQRFQRLFE